MPAFLMPRTVSLWEEEALSFVFPDAFLAAYLSAGARLF